MAAARSSYFLSVALAVVTGSIAASSVLADPPPTKKYRTIVVFGDTQHLVDEDDAQYQQFIQMVDWVNDNKNSEDIDFVLHVGDIIESGSALPLDPSCLVGGVCQAGCACFRRDLAELEWTRFNAQWDRLTVPGAIVRGNHDNVGVDDPDDPLDTRGYEYYYGQAHFESLEAQFAGGNRPFDYLETCPEASCPNRDAHAWKFQLGSEQVIVVGPSGFGGGQRDWVKSVLDQHPQLPAIILAHRGLQFGDALRTEIVEVQPYTEQIFMTAQGHLIEDDKRILDFGGFEILSLLFNYQQGALTAGAPFIALLRFFFDEQGIDRVEVHTFSPPDLEFLTDEELPNQPFSIDNDNDNDEVLNPDDNCSNGPSGDPDQTDSDADGFGDLCDDDGAENNIPPGTQLFLSTQTSAALPGPVMTFGDADLAQWDSDTNTATLFFSDENFASNENIDAAHVLLGGNIVLSTTVAAVLGSNELSFEKGDLVEYDPVSDTAWLFFDNENFAGVEDIDAVYVFSNGHIALSTKNAATLGGLSFENGDLVEYNPDTDTASLFLGQAAFQGMADIDGVHVFEGKGAMGTILLSTRNTASLGGLDFSKGDVIAYDPAMDTALLFFSESNFASVENIDAVHVVPEPSAVLMLIAGIALLATVGRRRMRR